MKERERERERRGEKEICSLSFTDKFKLS